MVGPQRAACAGGNLRGDRPSEDDADLRQHACAGGIRLPGALAHQRARAADRAASRFARRGAKAQGGGRHVGRAASRGRVHVDARSRHRLGRRRSRRQCRRSQRREPVDAAHRPRQSSTGRIISRAARAGQSLRGSGMCGGGGRGARRRAGHARRAARRTGRAVPTYTGVRLHGAVRSGRSVRGNIVGRSLCGRGARDLRPRARLRGDRRLCAEELRPLRENQKKYRRGLAHRKCARRAGLSDECRRYRRGDEAEGAANTERGQEPRAFRPAEQCKPEGSWSGLHRPAHTRRPGARRDRGIFHRDAGARRHVSVRRRDSGAAGHRRERGAGASRAGRRAQNPLLHGRQISALDLSGRARARHACEPGELEASAGAGARLAGRTAQTLRAAQARQSAGRNISTRESFFHGGLSVRGAARAPDARHAADAPHGALRAEAARFRRQ